MDRHAHGPAFPGAGRGAQPLGRLLLNHDSDGGEGQLLLQQTENHRGGDVVGQVGADTHRSASELLPNKLVKVQLHHIPGDNLHVATACQGLLQHRKQPLVQLDSGHLLGHLGQFPGEHPDAGPHLDDSLALTGAALCRHPGTNDAVNEEVLPQGFGKMKSVAGQHLFDLSRVGKMAHTSSSCSVT